MLYFQIGVIVLLVNFTHKVFSNKLGVSLTIDKVKGPVVDLMNPVSGNRTANILLTLLDVENQAEVEGAKIRTKRQGAGKFTDAAKMSQLKTARLYGQMFKNVWADSYVGGAHPFHPEVPKAIVFLFKHKVLNFFFPDVGQPVKGQ